MQTSMMKRFGAVGAAALMIFGVSRYVGAQFQTPLTATPVSIVGQRGDAATRCDSAAGSGAQTLTLQNPGPGLSAYVTSVIAYGEATGTVSAVAPVAITTTGFSGTAPTLGSVNLTAWTVGATTGPGLINFGFPLKANTNTAATIAAASVANLSWRLTACYYVAP